MKWRVTCFLGIEPQCSLLQIQGTSGGNTQQCISAVIPGGDSHSVILGDNFMRAWYTVYTYDQSSKTAYVGIAEAAAMTSIGAALPSFNHAWCDDMPL